MSNNKKDTIPEDWKKFHAENLRKMQPEKREAAIQFLRGYFADAPATVEEIRAAAAKKPQDWWSVYQFTWGMAVRNLLRRHHYGEADLGIDNLDDVYVGLIEAALLGVIE